MLLTWVPQQRFLSISSISSTRIGPEAPIWTPKVPNVRQSALRGEQRDVNYAIRHCGDGVGGSGAEKVWW